MSGWAELVIGGGIICVLGAVLGVNQWASANGLKKRLYHEDGTTVFLPRKEAEQADRELKKRLYYGNGTTVFLPRKEAEQMEGRIVTKIDELKTMVQDMDDKREAAKNDYQRDLRKIYSRLATIEAKLP